MKHALAAIGLVVTAAVVPAAADTLTVMTWNVYIGLQDDAYTRQQMAWIARQTPRPDVVVMQEVNSNLANASQPDLDSYVGGLNDATPGRPWRGFFNGEVYIATALPAGTAEPKTLPYCDGWSPSRPALRVPVTLNGTTVQIFVTHLQAGSGPNPCSLTPETARQQSVRDLLQWAANYPGPRLIGGDFNATPDAPEISGSQGMASGYVDAWPQVSSASGFTFGYDNTQRPIQCNPALINRRIDYWFAQTGGGATPTAATILGASTCFDGYPSDHLALRVQYSITTQPPPPPPTGWTSEDIGAVGLAGSTTLSNGTFTVAGAGSNIWDTADSFRFVHRSLAGDGDIIVRAMSEQNTSVYAKAGIMLREGTAANAAHVVLDIKPDGGVEFMQRGSTGGATTFISGATVTFPAWLRLRRSGSTIRGSVSSDGLTWTDVGSTPASLPTSVEAGLAVTSQNTSQLNSATFEGASVLPVPWLTSDVGAVGVTGNAGFNTSGFTVAGAGSNIWGTSDSFRFVYQPLNGDGQIVARLLSMNNTNQYAKAGVMMRESLAADAAHAILDVKPDHGLEFMTRPTAAASTTFVAGETQAPPAWLQLSRSGSQITAKVSADGTTWRSVGSTSLAVGSTVYVGLVVSSIDVTTLNTATFDSVSTTAGGTGGPANVVIYASDLTSALHGTWNPANSASSPNSVKAATLDAGWASADSPLTGPADYIDVSFNAPAGVPHTLWLRLQAAANSKFNDSVWVQFSDALADGSTVYPIGSATGLLVNLATDSTGASLNGWGWVNNAYWLAQTPTITFATSGPHTLRIQVREDGVELDQIVLSPSTYLNTSPGIRTNDSTIVPKP